jgi:hypothetical protein
MESCALRYFGESSNALMRQPAPAARLAAIFTAPQWAQGT